MERGSAGFTPKRPRIDTTCHVVLLWVPCSLRFLLFFQLQAFSSTTTEHQSRVTAPATDAPCLSWNLTRRINLFSWASSWGGYRASDTFLLVFGCEVPSLSCSQKCVAWEMTAQFLRTYFVCAAIPSLAALVVRWRGHKNLFQLAVRSHGKSFSWRGLDDTCYSIPAAMSLSIVLMTTGHFLGRLGYWRLGQCKASRGIVG